MAGLSIKDQQARYDKIMKGYEEGKEAGLRIAQDTREPTPRSSRQHPVPRYGIGGYEDNPYDDFGKFRGPTIPNPNPGQGFDWAHDLWRDNSTNWAYFSGGVQLPDGSWIYPTKDGKYIPESDEKEIERIKYQEHRQNYDRLETHPHQASIYMGEQFPNKFDQILNPTGVPNPPRPSLNQLREGVDYKKKMGLIRGA